MSEHANRMQIPASGPDANPWRKDFPVLHQAVHGKPLVYLDSAASSQQPQSVITAVSDYASHDHANVHRGVHTLSQRATDAFEGARETVAGFVNAAAKEEIVFVRGTTEAINLVAQGWGRPRLGPGDEVLITRLEHHSNIVPWQMLCEQTGATLRVVPIDRRGQLEQSVYGELLGPKTKLVAFGHVSNALGTVNPVQEMTRQAHAVGAVVLIDGAQAAPHLEIDVQAIGCDFYAFSGHKMYAPTGIGALYGRRELLDDMTPWQGGGDMILAVSFERTVYNEVPHKFEAGTPNIGGAVGLAAACNYLQAIGHDAVAAYEHRLLSYAKAVLAEVPGLNFIGTAEHKAAVVSFTLDGIHPHDIGTIVDAEGVAIRTGHHCAMPVMDFFGVPATARASLGLYNTTQDLDELVRALHLCHEVLG